MVEILYILGLVLGIVASICTISFTYYQYIKSKKDQRKGHQMRQHLMSQITSVTITLNLGRDSSYTAVSSSLSL